jgi:hypothetical protein
MTELQQRRKYPGGTAVEESVVDPIVRLAVDVRVEQTAIALLEPERRAL